MKLVDDLCAKYGCLPGQILDEDASELLQHEAILAEAQHAQ